jgi:asparagine synthase (glutamine-hydrolysing)
MRGHGTFDRLDVLREITHRLARWHCRRRSRTPRCLGGHVCKWPKQPIAPIGWRNDPLIKLDRCLMAHGVEGRTPFLDPGMAAAAFRLPDKLKIS